MSENKNKTLITIVSLVVLSLIIGGIWFLSRREKPAKISSGQSTNLACDPEKLPADQYCGEVLAGKTSPLLDFQKADFEKALKTDKLIVLYFYANWCPICKEEVPKLEAAFNELETDRVIGFRANYNDSETDSAEVDLAREHGIGYQHTKVFIKAGQRLLKSPESWEKQRYLDEIDKFKDQS